MSALSPRDDCCPDSDSGSEVDEVEEAETFQSRGNDSNRGADQRHAMHGIHSEESRFWYFEGKLTMDWGRPGDYSMPDKDALAAHFGGNDCHKTAPFTVIHMHILASLSMAGLGGIFGNTFTVPVRVYIQARQTTAEKWASWLHSKGVLLKDQKYNAIPRSEIIELVDSPKEEEWILLVRSGTRPMYDVRGTAWNFEGTILMDVDSNDDINFVEMATKAFQDSTGAPGTLPNGTHYLAVLGDLRSPITGASGRVEIPIRGYIQCRSSDWKRWLDWQPDFEFDVAHKGLGSDEHYRMGMELLKDGSSGWYEIYTFGKLQR